MKNKHSNSEEDQSQDYVLFEKLYENLRSYITYLNRFTDNGIIPEKIFIRELEFGTKMNPNLKKNPNEEQTRENIEDIKTRIKQAEKSLQLWEKKKQEYLKNPYELKNYISLQFLGKSLIKVDKNNFQFYIKFFEVDLKMKLSEDKDFLSQNKNTIGKMEFFHQFFTEYSTIVDEIISKKTIRNSQGLKFLKYVNIPLDQGYNFILNKFRSTLKQEYTADQILFCSWHSKWSEIESKLLLLAMLALI